MIIGIARLMVVIMWLTGGKKPQATGKTTAPTVLKPAPVEVNETKIAELQSRIQDLQKQQIAAQNGPHFNNDDHAIRSSGIRTETAGRREAGDIPHQRSNAGR